MEEYHEQNYFKLTTKHGNYGVYISSLANNICRQYKNQAVQRKGLSLCLGLAGISGREAMEVEADIQPIQRIIKEIAVRVQSKNIAEPIQRQPIETVFNQQRHDTYEQQESQSGKAINRSIDMIKATKMNIKLIEPEFTYKAGSDQMGSPSRHGSSKSRTADQTVECKEVLKDLL